MVAQLSDFAPNPDGYNFPNYGNEGRTYQDDLGAADLIDMFGSDAVCASGSTPEDCTLTAAAQAWIDEQNAGMNDGHCEGMAVTSLRFWAEEPFYNDKMAPGDFQDGAETVYDLKVQYEGEYEYDAELAQPVENYIAYYFVLQGLDEVAEPTGNIRQNNTPVQILDLLIAQFRDNQDDPYTFGIYKADLSGGHAISPYAVEDKGDNVYWLYVYDNNFPGEVQYVEFNRTNDTWNYTIAAVPGEPPDVYTGTAETHTST